MLPKLLTRGSAPQSEIDPTEATEEQLKQQITHELNEFYGQVAGAADGVMEKLFTYNPQAFFKDQRMLETLLDRNWFPVDEIRAIEQEYPVALSYLSVLSAEQQQGPERYKLNEYRWIFEISRRRMVVEKTMLYIENNKKITDVQYDSVGRVAEELTAASLDTNPRVQRESKKELDRYCHDVLAKLVDIAGKVDAKGDKGVTSHEFTRMGMVYDRISGGRDYDKNVTRRAVAAGLEALYGIDKSMKSPGKKLTKTVESLNEAFKIGEAGGPGDDDYELFRGLAKIIARDYETTAASFDGMTAHNKDYQQTGRRVDLLEQLITTLRWQVQETLSNTARVDRPRNPMGPAGTKGATPTFDGREINGITITDDPEGGLGGVVRISRARVARAAIGGVGGAAVISTIMAPASALDAVHTEEPNVYTVTVPTPAPESTVTSEQQEPVDEPSDSTTFIDEQSAQEPTDIGITVEQIPDPSLTETPSDPTPTQQPTTHVPIEVSDADSHKHVFMEQSDAEAESGLAKTPQEMLAEYLSKNQEFIREDAYNLFDQAQASLAVGDVRVDAESTKNAQEAVNQILAGWDDRFNEQRTDMSKDERIAYILQTLTVQYVLTHPDYLASHNPEQLIQQDTNQRQRALLAVMKQLNDFLGPEFVEELGQGRGDTVLRILTSAEVQILTDKELQKFAPHRQRNGGGKHGHQSHNNGNHVEHNLTQNEIEKRALKRMEELGPEWKNRALVMEYFMKRGYEAYQVSGLIGNLCVEAAGCELDPGIKQYGGGPGRGWAQWGSFTRPDYDRFGHDFSADLAAQYGVPALGINHVGTLRWWAHQHGMAWDTATAQLGFINYEFSHGFGDDLHKTKTLIGATSLVLNGYERPAERIIGLRLKYARETLDKFQHLKDEVRKEARRHGHEHGARQGTFFERGSSIMNKLHHEYGDVSGKLRPNELQNIGPAFGGHRLYPEAATTIRYLSQAFQEEFGYPLGMTDSYRSFKTQVALYNDPDKIVNGVHLGAVPGTSNHGWGLAVDIGEHGVNDYNSPQYKWLMKHAGKYGWANPAWARQGGDKEEPWHWEYVGGVRLKNGHPVTKHHRTHHNTPEHSSNHEQQRKFKGPISKEGYTTPIDERLYVQYVPLGTAYDGYHTIPGVHTGYDIPVSFVPFRAVRGGTVIRVGEIGLDIYAVEVRQDDGKFAVYEHVKPGSVKVKVGEKINIGQHIGTTGNSGASTGASTAPHLHVSIQNVPGIVSKNDPDVYATTDDPMDYLPSVDLVRGWIERHG